MDSRFKGDSEVGCESLDGRAVSEALPRCSVEVPDDVVNVSVGVVSKSSVAREVASEQAIRVLDREALSRAARITKVGVEADGYGNGSVPGELPTVVVVDGAAGVGGQTAQRRPDGLGGEVGISAMKAGERQQVAPLLQRQQEAALAAEVHELNLPVAELAAELGICCLLMDRRAVGHGGFALAVAPPPAALGLALRQKPRQARPSSGRAISVAVDGLRADPVF